MGAEESHLSQKELSESIDIASKDNALESQRDYLSFFVNGHECTVLTNGHDPEIGPTYLLVDYLRDKLGLTGTKYMCRAGGCGSCIVTVKSLHPVTGEEVVGSVNSCLLPLYSCDGLDITTVEALGNRREGYSQIQHNLVKFGGTQCGFCTPGFIMNMHSVALSNPNFTSKDVEYSFDGNICRCTGFRPIMDAFKALSIDPSEELKRKCVDIEDLHKCPLRKPLRSKTESESGEKMEIVHLSRNLHLRGPAGEQWITVGTLQKLCNALQYFVSARVRYRLVAGYTGTGVFQYDGPYQGYIEINDIPELKQVSISSNGIVFGGGVTLTAAIDAFKKASTVEGLCYADQFFHHWRLVACLSVRNRGTLAGNLMLKHMHREFYSDVFLLLETVGARLRIGSSMSLDEYYTPLEFLNIDMYGKVILSIHLPAFHGHGDFFFRSFKIAKRYQQAYADVNAAFLFEFEPNSKIIRSRPRICFGGINPKFVHAIQTEEYLEGKQLNNITLQKAMSYLQYEAVPDIMPGSTSPDYRLGLAQSFLYKVLLQLMGNEVIPILRSGAYEIKRELNKGQQVFDTDRSKWPLNKPIPKIESYPQASGEAEYINDIRPEHDELHGAFVVTTVGNASIKSIDASQALSVPGVVGFYTAKDIPGVNNYTPDLLEPEEVFAERFSKYAGQSVGLLVARSRQLALDARRKVIIKYDNFAPPVVDIAQAVKNLPKGPTSITELQKLNVPFPCKGIHKSTANELVENLSQKIKNYESTKEKLRKGKDTLYKVKGEFQTSAQYHFHLETQACLCVPKEDGMDIWSGTQNMETTQNAIATVLNVPNNTLTMYVRRLGGSFGGKVSKGGLVASACALAAHITHHPVRVVLDLETNMQMIGKRLPYLSKYEVEVDENGKIHQLENKIYCDAGAIPNEPTSLYAMVCSQSCYQANDWNAIPGVVSTNTAPNTYCRAPGSATGIAIIENIMEHIARVVHKDPLHVREVNFINKGDPLIGVPGAKLVTDNPLPRMIAELKASCDYDSRKKYIDDFNMVVQHFKNHIYTSHLSDGTGNSYILHYIATIEVFDPMKLKVLSVSLLPRVRGIVNRWMKRGISMVPSRYPNTYSEFRFPTFISVHQADGSVNVSHGAIEMGQGVNTKVAQVVAYTLQIPLDKVKVKPTNSIISPNTTVSAASVASELACSSARRACLQLLEKLAPVRKTLGNPTWEELISAANLREILLTSQFQEQNGDVTSYDIWGVACTEVEVDVLTGEFKIVRADVLYDAGESLSPLVDIGQIEGSYVFGLGWWLTEEHIYDKTTGALLTDDTWTYKPMLPADIPEDFRVIMQRNAPNPFGVLSSKATAEPPLNMSVSVIFALRHAIDSARRDVGDVGWYQMDGPVTREKVRKLALTSAAYFTFK